MRKFCQFSMFLVMQFFALHTFAQVAVPAGLAARGIVSLIGGNKEKKQEKIIEKSTSKETVNGTSVTILRVKDAEIKSKAKAAIIKVQNRLDEYAELCKSGARLNLPKKDSDIYNIQTLDSDWPTTYYENELKAYKKYESKFDQHIKDSITAINNAQVKKAEDSLAFVKKHAADSLANANKVVYNYINKAYVIVKETPSDQSKTLGVLYVGSYIRPLGAVDKTPFVKISFQNVEGYVDKNSMVDNIDKITVPNADLVTYKSKVYCKYAAKP